MSEQELLTRLTSELPGAEPVEPLAFLEDAAIPSRLALVEPLAFVLACVQALWGPHGPRN